MKYSLLFLVPFIMQGQSGYDIARSMDMRPAPKDLSNKTNMILKNSKGKTRNHVMVSRSMDNNQKQIIWFLEPKDDRGVAFLKIEHDNKDDEMQMWLPAFKKVRRISAKKKGDAFMGSDLSYEDLSNRDLDENNYQRLNDEYEKRGEYDLIKRVFVKDSHTNHTTEVLFTDIKVDSGLKDDLFHEKNLKRLPKN